MENVAAGATTFAPNVVKTTASATALCLDRHPREEAFKYHPPPAPCGGASEFHGAPLSSLCFIELCAGSARLSSMMRARGFQVTAVDHKTDTSPNIQYSPLT